MNTYYLAKECTNKSVICITYGHNGGMQALASMLLVINELVANPGNRYVAHNLKDIKAIPR